MTNRIFQHHLDPVGKVINSSPNKVGYLCDRKYTNKNKNYQLIGFQNRCPSFMIPEVLDWYFKKEKKSPSIYLKHIDNVASMIEFANFNNVMKIGVIPNFYLGYIEKYMLDHVENDIELKNFIYYHVVFYTDFDCRDHSGVKLEFIYVYNKLTNELTLDKMFCSSDHRSYFYSKINDGAIIKRNILESVLHKYQMYMHKQEYVKSYTELEDVLNSLRHSVSVDIPIVFDKVKWHGNQDYYPFFMKNAFCNVYHDKELTSPYYLTSHLLCICVDEIVTTPIINKLDGICVIDNMWNNTYLDNLQFIAKNEHPDFTMYYKQNNLLENKIKDLESALINNDSYYTNLVSINESIVENLLGVNILDENVIKSICINHPLAMVSYIGATRKIINDITDKTISKFLLLKQIHDEGMEVVGFDDDNQKILIRKINNKEKSQAVTTEELKNMDKKMVQSYLDDLLKNGGSGTWN